jgi:prevent-host-death family protein
VWGDWGVDDRRAGLTMVVDHGINGRMKEIAISVFKAKCLGILEEVRKTRKPIRITRFGEPVAEVVPSTAEKSKGRRLGSMAGSMKIVGDIVGPTGSLDDWDAWRE